MTSPWDAVGWTTFAGVDIYVCRGIRPGPKAVIVGGIHGDEYEGPLAALELAHLLRPEEVSGTIAIVPVANLAALLAGTRVSPADGQNLARTFPGDPAGSETERLAHALFSWIRETSFAIDLHSGGVEYDFAPLAGFYGDPVAGNASFEAAQRFGLPFLWSLPLTAGVLSNALRSLDVPVVGCEYRGGGQLAPDGVQAYVDGACSCLRYWGLLQGLPLEPQGKAIAGDWQIAPATGFYIADKILQEPVRMGETIARIVDRRGSEVHRFRALENGIVLALRSKAFITAGNWGVLSARHG